MRKEWNLLSEAGKEKGKLSVEEITKILLENRGIRTREEIDDFLHPPDPFRLTARELEIDSKEVTKAVKRIKKAIKEGEKIIVYGDYDTDGVCAAAIMWQAIFALGAKKAMPFIPKRETGYGMRVEQIDEFAKEGVSLIVTVDNGVISYPQVGHAKKLGIDVVVTDHHLPGKAKLKATALVHTTKLSGCGVAWFLANQLKEQGLELVTLGTIADVMPLQGPNRAIVKKGLTALRTTKIPGLLALYQAAGIAKEKIGTYEVGYIIGPRLNAAGRMEDPMEALRLLCTPRQERALDLANKIDRQNRERQLLTAQTTLHARDLWLTADGGKGSLIFVSHESYEEGIVGLVAGKLMEEFYRPTIIVSRGEIFSRASARSISGFNILEAIRSCADLLGSHGGHAQAAGFTVETAKLTELKTRLRKIADQEIDKTKLIPLLKIDLELELENLSSSFWEKLREFEPYGFGNPEPVFLTRNLTVADTKVVGSSSQHLKLRVTSATSQVIFEAIGFGFGDYFSRLSPGKPIDLAYNLIADEWNGEKCLQLKIKDIRLSHGN